MKQIKEKYEDLFAKSDENMSKIKQDPNQQTYARAIALLSKRLTFTRSAAFVDGNDQEPEARLHDVQKDLLTVVKEAPDFVAWRKECQDVEPYPQLEKALSVSQLLHIVSTMDVQSQDDVKEQKQFKEVVDACKGMLGKVGEQHTRLVSLYNRAEKERVSKQVQRQEEEDNQAEIPKKKGSSEATEKEDSRTLVLHMLQFCRQAPRGSDCGVRCHDQIEGDAALACHLQTC